MNSGDVCTAERHEADKLSPAALAANYDEHAEVKDYGRRRVRHYTCRSCKSTICTTEFLS